MKVVAELVIDSDGRPSVWLAESLSAAKNYAVRVHGVVADLVTEWEAQQEATAAYRRGLIEGQSLASSAQCPQAACGSSLSSGQT